MTRVLIHVEGQTEETFVNEVLQEHLCNHGYQSVSARLVGNARQRDRRGGIRAWTAVKKDIINHLKEDNGCLATTMVDYYGLPQDGDKAWPGRAEAGAQPFGHKAGTVENALHQSICNEIGGGFDPSRFVPYVMMHEFEALLFSDCSAFAVGIARVDLTRAFQQIRDDFANPEEINDSPITAPSKRVQQLMPNYEKPLHGNLAALRIGLGTIRTHCPHFRQWLERLEAWPKVQSGRH